MTEHDRTADDATHPEPLIDPAGPAPAGDESASHAVAPAHDAAPEHEIVSDHDIARADGTEPAPEPEHVAAPEPAAHAVGKADPVHPHAEHTVAEHPDAEHTDAEHARADHAAATGPVADPAPAAAATPTPERVVYVPAPQPPRKRGARGVGVGVALASSLIFTVLYALLAALFISIGGPTAIAERVQVFAATPSFWMPVIAFTLGYLLLVLIVNRAGWWAHVLGGFLVAALVYVVFIASTVLSAQAVGAPPQELQQFLLLQITNPLGWAAAIAAREVPIWVGGLVARRGRTAKARNVEARETYERELAEARATGGDRAV